MIQSERNSSFCSSKPSQRDAFSTFNTRVSHCFFISKGITDTPTNILKDSCAAGMLKYRTTLFLDWNHDGSLRQRDMNKGKIYFVFLPFLYFQKVPPASPSTHESDHYFSLFYPSQKIFLLCPTPLKVILVFLPCLY